MKAALIFFTILAVVGCSDCGLKEDASKEGVPVRVEVYNQCMRSGGSDCVCAAKRIVP